MSKELKTKIAEINAQLRSLGAEAVQEIKMTRDGKVVGQVRYGFKPQYVFDAVNEILMPENWRYEVLSREILDSQVVAEVKLFIRVQDHWLCKGSQMGQMQIVKGNVGDAFKGAITDAIQKCLSLLSIGSDAYKGLLRDVYLSGNSRHQELNRQEKAKQPQQKNPPKPTDELPMIAGIKYQQKEGVVIAVGNVYDKRELLKSAGFKWDKSDKNWFKELTVH